MKYLFKKKNENSYYPYFWVFFEYYLVKVSLIFKITIEPDKYVVPNFPLLKKYLLFKKRYEILKKIMFMVKGRRLQKYIFCFHFLMCSETLGEKCENPNSSYMTLKQSLYTCSCEPYNEDYISNKPSYLKFIVSMMKLYFQRYV